MKRSVWGMCALVLLALPGSATTIPITGTVSHGRDLNFRMQGDSFSAEAWLETIGIVGVCDPSMPCNASRSIDPLADQAGGHYGTVAEYQGVTAYWHTGQLSVLFPMFDAPVLTGSTEMQSITLPFVVTGWIESWERVGYTGLYGNEVLNMQISGQGTATINGRFPDPDGPFVMYDFRGDFSGTASTVPEPTTMALTAVGIGLAALAQRRFRRRPNPIDC